MNSIAMAPGLINFDYYYKFSVLIYLFYDVIINNQLNVNLNSSVSLKLKESSEISALVHHRINK